MRQLKELVREFSESGHLETQILLENQLIKDLTTKMLLVDPKDHIEFVLVKGQLDALQILQSRRDELMHDD